MALLLLAAGVAVGCEGATFGPTDVEGTFQGTFKSGNENRSYLVHVPPTGQPDWPLIVALHGSPSTGLGMQTMSGLDVVADQLGFAVAYPDAVVREWAVGCDCTFSEFREVDDLAFFVDLIDELDRRVGVDRSRVFAVGFSQGALMAFLIGCELADHVAAVGSVGATMLTNVADDCDPSRPMPIVMIHGSEDEEFPPQGRAGLSASTVSIEESVDVWTAANGCTGPPDIELEPDAVADSTVVVRTTYDMCQANSEVVYYEVQGGGHTWPGSSYEFPVELGATSFDIVAQDIFAQFFLRFSRP